MNLGQVERMIDKLSIIGKGTVYSKENRKNSSLNKRSRGLELSLGREILRQSVIILGTDTDNDRNRKQFKDVQSNEVVLVFFLPFDIL